MTHDEALLKLVAVEPITQTEMVRVTGWPHEETLSCIERLVQESKVTYIHVGGHRLYRAGASHAQRRASRSATA